MKGLKKLLSNTVRHFLGTKKARVLLVSFAAVVVFVTTYLLILPAIALDKEAAQEQGGIEFSVPSEQNNEESVVTKTESESEQIKTVKQEATTSDTAEKNKTDKVNKDKIDDKKKSEHTLTAEGKTYTITVKYDEAAKIPEGTKLVVKEIESDTDAYIQHLGQLWSEINKKYFKVEKMRQHYDESMGELPDVHLTNINMARFFSVSLMDGGKEIEPKAPVQVKISYDKGLYAPKGTKPGVVHFVSEKDTDIIKDVDATVSDKEATSFQYEQDSFSDIGTYVGQETNDLITNPDKRGSANSKKDAPKSVNLSNDAVEDIIKAAAKPAGGTRGADGEEPDTGDDSDLEKPVGNKQLTPNDDGTYTLSLSVKGHSSVSHEELVKKSNILFVMDRSSSMITKKVNNESTRWYYGTKNTSSWRGDITEANGYHFIGIVNGRDVDLNVSYDWPGSWSNPVITYTQNGQTQNYPDDAPIYVVSHKTRMTAEQEALNNLFTELLDMNDASGSREDVVELSVISFGDQRFDYKTWSNETEADGWTKGKNASALSSVVSSNRYTSGTNWEEAMQYAYDVISAKKQSDGADEDYYVVFLTDGEPTAVKGESGSAYHTTDPVTGEITNGNGNIYAYDEAKDDAKTLVDEGFKFYNIFTYRTTEDEKYSIYLTNYAYGNGNYNGDTTTDAVTNYFADAQTPEDVVNALNNIFYTVEDAIGHANVSITDTMTTDAMTTTVVHGKTNGYVYEVKNASGTVLYTVTATGDLSDPTVTFNVPGSSVENYNATASTVGDKTVYTVTTAEGRTYKMALADINDTTGELVWDLSPVGMLLDDCTYSVNFIVWPDQDAYDYVAGLNNNLPGYTWDTSAPTYEDLISTKGYAKGGVQQYPSIVKYPNGTFAVLTNTEQKLHYSVVETETINGEPQGDPVVTGPFYHDLPLPEPMPLEASVSSIEKVWNVERDPRVLAQLLYNLDGTSRKYSITFDILQGSEMTKYTDVTLGWDSTQEKYVWEADSEQIVPYNGNYCVVGTRWKEEFAIATGLMLSEERMDALGLDKTAYPFGSFKGTKYFVLETGHDYTISEPELTYAFDFSSPTYHPMLVDGKLQSVNFTQSGDEITITKMTSEEDGLSSLKIENTLRGYINLDKVVVDEDEQTVVDKDDTKFTYTVVLNNDTDPGPFTLEGSHVPWYGISGLFYHDDDYNYYQAEPNEEGHVILTDESGTVYDALCEGTFAEDVGPVNITYTDSSGSAKTIRLHGNQMDHDSDNHVSATIKIHQKQTLNIANVPVGTTYTITEADQDGYKLVRIEREIKENEEATQAESSDTIPSEGVPLTTNVITGSIVANRDNHITYYNRTLVADIEIQKLDGEGHGLPGAVFELRKVGDDGHSETPAGQIESVRGLRDFTKTIDGQVRTFTSALETTGDVQTITGLPDGTYRLYESLVPDGYICTYQYIEFKVEGRVVLDVTTDTGDISNLDFTAASGSGEDAKLALLKISNEPGAVLPEAGGSGTTLIYLFGGLICLSAAIALVVRRRMLKV